MQLKIPACTIDDLDLIRKSRRRHRIGRQCHQHRQYCRLFDVQAIQNKTDLPRGSEID